MRREFSANVSHELKTPLTTVAGYAELLASGLAKPEDAQGFGQKILDEAGRLLVLIDDIMRLSKLDEGAPDAQMQIVNLGEIAKEAAERMRPLAEKQGIALAVGTIPWLRARAPCWKKWCATWWITRSNTMWKRVACACRSKMAA